MDTYDYSNNTNHIETLSQTIEHLSEQEADRALNAIQEFKESYIATQKEAGASWFIAAILPLLQSFAQMSASILNIEEPNEAEYVVTIKKQYGLDISESCHAIKIALTIAKHIAVNVEDNFATLTLIFDCSNFIK